MLADPANTAKGFIEPAVERLCVGRANRTAWTDTALLRGVDAPAGVCWTVARICA